MKRLVIAVLLAFGLLGVGLESRSQDAKEAKGDARVWMKAKSGLAREILVNLTNEDFDKIKKNATDLNLVQFFESITPNRSDAYRQQVMAFALANRELINQADAKNVYGATLAFNQLTVSCVQCHALVRDKTK